MNNKHYLLSEKDSTIIFAVIKDINGDTIPQGNIKLINKVGQAIEDEYCIEDRAKIVHDSIIETNGDFPKIYMSFRYLDDEEEERIIDVELNLVAIY